MTSRRWFALSFATGTLLTFVASCDDGSCANGPLPSGTYEITGTDDVEVPPPMETGQLVYSAAKRLVTVTYDVDDEPRTVVLRVLELDEEGRPILPGGGSGGSGGSGGAGGAGGRAQGGSTSN